MQMKVLEVFGEPIIHGGQETFVLNIIEYIDRTNIEKIDVLTPYYCENEFFKNEVILSGGSLIELNVAFNPGKSRANIKKPIQKHLSKERYDVVHIHTGSTSVLAIIATLAKKNGVKKVVVHSHCGIENPTIKNRIVKEIGGLWINRRADVFCACSKVAAEARYSKSAIDKVIYLNNGIDLNKFKFDRDKRNSVRDMLGIDENVFVIGHIGRFSYQKNHEFLVKIFYEFLQKHPNSVLLMIGDGELKESIEDQVKNLCISKNTIFIGVVDNVYDYVQAFDVFLLPSRFEGLPIVGIETQASGLSIVTSTNVSNELDITGNVHYLDLEAPINEWVNALEETQELERKDVTDIITKNGYSIESTVKKILSIYTE